MYNTVSQWDFINAFATSEDHKDAFSRKALLALFQYLEEEEEESGEQREFCMISLGMEYMEYKNLKEAADDYNLDFDGADMSNTDEIDMECRDYFTDSTTLLEFDGGVIVAEF